MNVHCDQCKTDFDVPLHGAVKIDYERCRNVFRVSYRYRTSCPKCHTVLQLTPYKKDQALGVPYEFGRDELTEKMAELPVQEVTLPRTLVSDTEHEPTPTVRVTKKTDLPVAKPFQLIQDLPRPKPLHVSLRGKKKNPIPFLKIFLIAVITLSTLATAGLTLLALRPEKKSPPPASIVPKSEAISPSERAARPVLAPQGGPENDGVEVIDPAEPIAPAFPIKVKSTRAPKRSLELRHLDKLTSTYGMRVDPFTDDKSFHGGIDIAAENRSEVRAAMNGKVKFIGEKGGYGNIVIVAHGEGYETLYGHLAKPLVREGARVKQGDLIGLVGSTGRSTGPHLHFELHKDGKKVDPLQVKSLAKKFS